MSLGPNVKITAPEATRRAQQALYADALGCAVRHPTPEMDVFVFPDGACVGVAFVPEGEALSVEQARRGAWLEYRVADVDRVVAALAAQGLTPFAYHDTAHRYFQAPGGQVFRLAAQG